MECTCPTCGRRFRRAERVSEEQPQILSSKGISRLPEVQAISCTLQEHVLIVHLSTKHYPLRVRCIHIGGLSGSLVDPRSIWRDAVSVGDCAAIVLVHNHPSGDTSPSSEDLSITRRLISGGRLLGIELLDHVIVEGPQYTSLRDEHPDLWRGIS